MFCVGGEVTVCFLCIRSRAGCATWHFHGEKQWLVKSLWNWVCNGLFYLWYCYVVEIFCWWLIWFIILIQCKKLAVSVEMVLPIVYQPQDVFRICPINRCSATLAGISFRFLIAMCQSHVYVSLCYILCGAKAIFHLKTLPILLIFILFLICVSCIFQLFTNSVFVIAGLLLLQIKEFSVFLIKLFSFSCFYLCILPSRHS